MAALETITTIDLDVGLSCPAFDEGFLHDACHHFSSQLCAGKVYAVLSDATAGGWAVSCALAGIRSANSYVEGTLLVNDQTVSLRDLRKLSCYVSRQTPEHRWNGLLHRTVHRTLEKALSQSAMSHVSVDDLATLFQLSPSRIHRPIYHVGNERLNVLLALGYAQGKKVFCFPWSSPGWLHFYYPRLELCLGVLKKAGCIVILPTSDIADISELVDEVIEARGPLEVTMEYHRQERMDHRV